MPPLTELPTELLEHKACQFLDVASISQLSLVNRRLQRDITLCSELWATLVARHFGYVNQPLARPSNSECDEKEDVVWRAVFVAAWRDALALAPAALKESDVLQVYNQSSSLQPRELQIRQEIVLMQGLRRIPTSSKLIQLYAEVIRRAHLVPRVNAARTAKALRRLAL
jgi:hypothetical protein